MQVLEDIPIRDIARYIDWTFFFHAWELKGRYPQILDDPEKGEEARKLFDDARAMLEQVIAQKWLRAAAVVGLFPANAVGDDVVVYAAAGDVPPPPEASPRFGDDELCPPWVDDDDDDDGDGLPTWVEGDSLAPYLGTPAAFLDGALGLAGVGPGDVVCDVGCGDGRLATVWQRQGTASTR